MNLQIIDMLIYITISCIHQLMLQSNPKSNHLKLSKQLKTFNRPDQRYYVLIDNNFVKNRASQEFLFVRIWSFTACKCFIIPLVLLPHIYSIYIFNYFQMILIQLIK